MGVVMEAINIQFQNEERKAIVAEFSTAQDTDFWSNQGIVSKDDQRYLDFRARTAFNPGVEQSTTTPALKRAFSFLR